jgi:hypothetical protein
MSLTTILSAISEGVLTRRDTDRINPLSTLAEKVTSAAAWNLGSPVVLSKVAASRAGTL